VLNNILGPQSPTQGLIEGRASWQVEHVFRYSEPFRQLTTSGDLLELVEAVLGPDVRLLDDQLYWKPARVGGTTYLHRDSDFFGRLSVVTLWFALCDTDEMTGCLWMVPGSHRPDSDTPGARRRAMASSGGPVPGIRGLDFLYEIRTGELHLQPVPAQRGDVILIHRDVLHCSLENNSERHRLSYLIEYFEGTELERFRQEYRGMFEYHDRIRYVRTLREARGGRHG